MIYLFPPLSAHPSSLWCHWRSTHCFQTELIGLQDTLKRQTHQLIDVVNRWNGLQNRVNLNVLGSNKASSYIIENGQSLKMIRQLCQALPATVFKSERKTHQVPCDPCHSCPCDELSLRTGISRVHSQLYGPCWILVQSFWCLIWKAPLHVKPA